MIISKTKSSKVWSSLSVPIELIERRIIILRGHRVMLDRDLADLYGIQLKRLNEQVKRNVDRFPEDFMFQLTFDEGRAVLALRSQFAQPPPLPQKRKDRIHD
jgi:hypothetical protein